MTFEEALNVLGLKTDDLNLKATKRAYSERLKTIRPETDPDGFMALRQAYEYIRTTLRSGSQDETVAPQLEIIAASKAADPAGQHAATYSEQIDAILADPQIRNDAESWRALIRPRRQETVDDWIIFEGLLRDKLLDFYDEHWAEQSTHDAVETDDIALPIEPELAAGIVFGMNWDDLRTRQGNELKQLHWLKAMMGVEPIIEQQPRQRPMPDSSPERQSKPDFQIEILIGLFVFVVAVIGSFVYFSSGQLTEIGVTSSAPRSSSAYTQHNYEMLDRILESEQKRRFEDTKVEAFTQDYDAVLQLSRAEEARNSLQGDLRFNSQAMTFAEILEVIGQASSPSSSVVSPARDGGRITYYYLELIDNEEIQNRIDAFRSTNPQRYDELVALEQLNGFILSDQAAYLTHQTRDLSSLLPERNGTAGE